MQYLLLIYSAESDDANQDQAKMMADYGAFTQGIVQSGNFKSADRLKPVADRHHGARARRQDADHRRPVRRDPRAARRLLPGRGQGPRRGDRHRRQGAHRQARLDRGAAGLVDEARLAARRRARSRLPPPRGRSARHADPAGGRLRPRGGGAAGGVRGGGARLGSRRRPANPRAWLVAVGRRKAIDQLRRRIAFRARQDAAGQPRPRSRRKARRTNPTRPRRHSAATTCCG